MINDVPTMEQERAKALVTAQQKASELFEEIARRGLIRAQVSEKALNTVVLTAAI